MWIGPPLWISPMWPQQVGVAFFGFGNTSMEIPKGPRAMENISYSKFKGKYRCKSINFIQFLWFLWIIFRSYVKLVGNSFSKSRKPQVIVCKILKIVVFLNLKYNVVAYLRSMNIYLPAILMFILYKNRADFPGGETRSINGLFVFKTWHVPMFLFHSML